MADFDWDKFQDDQAPAAPSAQSSQPAAGGGFNWDSLPDEQSSVQESKTAAEIPFSVNLKLAAAGAKKKEKISILEEEYGRDSVREFSPGMFEVRQNGQWLPVEDSFLASVAANLPEMAAGQAGALSGAAAGAKLGAAAGSILGPGGAVLGGTVGGAMGYLGGGSAASALATLVKEKGAKWVTDAMGMKTEDDGREALQLLNEEFSRNLVYDAIGAGAMKIIPMAGKLVMKPIKKSLEAAGAISGESKEGIEFVSQLASKLTGKDPRDFKTIMQGGDDAKAVIQHINDLTEFTKKADKDKFGQLDPVTTKMHEEAVTMMEQTKKIANKMWEDGWDKLQKSGALGNEVDISKPALQLKSDLIESGLLKEGEEGLEFLTKPIGDGENILQIFDPGSQRMLKSMFEQIKVGMPSVDPAGGVVTPKPVSVAAVRKMIKGIDNVLESSGAYNAGNLAIDNQARGALLKLRGGLLDSAGDGLAKTTIDGIPAQKFYSDMRGKYSKFRDVFDTFAVPSQLGSDNKQSVAKVVDKLVGSKGERAEELFGTMAEATNNSPAIAESFRRMRQLRAAKNLAPELSADRSLRSAVGGGLIGISSPSGWANYLAEKQIKNMNRYTPISPATQKTLDSVAQGFSWFNSLKPDERQMMIRSPSLLREFTKIYTGETAAETEAAVNDALMQQLGQ